MTRWKSIETRFIPKRSFRQNVLLIESTNVEKEIKTNKKKCWLQITRKR